MPRRKWWSYAPTTASIIVTEECHQSPWPEHEIRKRRKKRSRKKMDRASSYGKMVEERLGRASPYGRSDEKERVGVLFIGEGERKRKAVRRLRRLRPDE